MLAYCHPGVRYGGVRLPETEAQLKTMPGLLREIPMSEAESRVPDSELAMFVGVAGKRVAFCAVDPGVSYAEIRTTCGHRTDGLPGEVLSCEAVALLKAAFPDGAPAPDSNC